MYHASEVMARYLNRIETRFKVSVMGTMRNTKKGGPVSWENSKYAMSLKSREEKSFKEKGMFSAWKTARG